MTEISIVNSITNLQGKKQFITYYVMLVTSAVNLMLTFNQL